MKSLGPSAIQATRARFRVSFLLSPDALDRDEFRHPVEMKNPSLAFLFRGAGSAPTGLPHCARRIPGESADKSSSST
jgi:hypothetical protein